MPEDKEVREVKGIIETIVDKPPIKFVKAGKDNYIYKTSVLLEDKTWHNISSFDSQEKCNEVLNKGEGGGKFVKGDLVSILEEFSKGFWNVKGISEADKIDTEMVRTNEEIAMDQEKGRVIGEVKGETIVSSHNENQIEKQCCLKVASMLGGIQSKEDCLSTAKWFYANLGTKWLE